MNEFERWWIEVSKNPIAEGNDDERTLAAIKAVSETAWVACERRNRRREWQPIETAPESGPFLVYGGMFRSELYADSKTREAVKVSGRAPYTMFHNKGEILFYVADADYHEVWVVNPTHWMPLPEAPQGEEK